MGRVILGLQSPYPILLSLVKFTLRTTNEVNQLVIESLELAANFGLFHMVGYSGRNGI